MKVLENKKSIKWQFDSLNDYKRKMLSLGEGDGEAGRRRADGWHGTNSWSEFIELLDNGDDKVASKIKTSTKVAIKDLEGKYGEELIGYKFDVTGQFFDVGLVLTGVPETWLEPEFAETEKPKVDLIINASFPDGTDLDKIISNAGKVLGIAKVLEDHDVLVSIKAITGGRGTDYDRSSDFEQLMEVNVKGYDEPLNYQKCSAIITPTFLRRGWFRMAEEVSTDLKGSYGKIINVENSIELRDDKAVDKLEQRLFTKDKR